MFWQTTYGFMKQSITALAQDLVPILQLEWQARESASLGDYYCYPPRQLGENSQSVEKFALYQNHIWFEGWKEPQFKNCGVILKVITERPLEVDKLLFSKLQGKVVVVERKIFE